MKKSTLIYIALAEPEPTGTNVGFENSWLLASATSYQKNQIWAISAPGIGKHESLGRIFPDISPDDGGRFELEIGAVLPDFLPNLDDQIDYILSVAHDSRQYPLCISNQMMQLQYVKDGASKAAIFPRILEDKFREKADISPEVNSSSALRSMVTMRTSINGHDAEDALSQHIEPCITTLITCINNLAGAFQVVDKNHFVYSTLLHSVSTLGIFYIAIRGKDPDAIKFTRIAPNVGRVALMPSNLDAEATTLLESELTTSENVAQPRRYLSYSRIAANSGLLQFALLQSVIAAEVATASFIKQRLFASGVSKGKWDKMKSDVTYSQMLNLYLFAYCPSDDKPAPDVLGALNRARGLRNEIMHEGVAEITQSDVDQILKATEEHLAYLERIAMCTSTTVSKPRTQAPVETDRPPDER